MALLYKQPFSGGVHGTSPLCSMLHRVETANHNPSSSIQVAGGGEFSVQIATLGFLENGARHQVKALGAYQLFACISMFMFHKHRRVA